MKIEITWISEALIELIEESCLTVPLVAEGTDISVSALRKYVKGEAFPSIRELIAIANFFAVPLDFLVGRCDRETSIKVLSDYGKHFMKLRLAPWEAYLTGRNRTVLQTKVEAPWPYNLLDELMKPNRWEEPVTSDQLDGLKQSLELLTDCEREAVLLYYRDGLNLVKIGEEFGLTRERIRQIISKGINKLLQPGILRCIRLGVQGAELESEAIQHYNDLKKNISKLEARQRELTILVNNLEMIVERKKKEETENKGVARKTDGILEDIRIEELELSARSFNCMKRSGVSTLGNLIQLAESGKMLKVRNFGNQSCREVLQKILSLTGIDYTPLYFDIETH